MCIHMLMSADWGLIECVMCVGVMCAGAPPGWIVNRSCTRGTEKAPGSHT